MRLREPEGSVPSSGSCASRKCKLYQKRQVGGLSFSQNEGFMRSVPKFETPLDLGALTWPSSMSLKEVHLKEVLER
eukprot:1143625-Pelagomonas_calceolata.AAC.3